MSDDVMDSSIAAGQAQPDAVSVAMPDPDIPLIVFDGVCVLCSGFTRTVVRLDRAGRFRFATAQSPLGEELYRRHGLRTDVYETSLVLIGGRAYLRLNGLVAVATELGWPWRALRVLRFLPAGWRDRLYRLIAENRYAWFGKRDSCEIPSPELRSRLIG
jgi:predicted DCC family thiol-disulfide oxidoreductase YuxK